LGAGWRLELFGSMATGFGTHESDIDATCFQADAPEQEQEGPGAVELLRDRLGPLLRAHPDFVILEQILGAKVPLLKLRCGGMLDIDLSCRNAEALQNSRLLRAYAQLDARVRDLCVLVKLWAKGSLVCGASGGHLSSYTFTLLTIYFLQAHLKLPCLPTSAFKDGRQEQEGTERIEAARDCWRYRSGRLSLAELICRFFWFYNFDFDWGHEVACVRLGIRRYATDELFQVLRGRLTTRIHIEDPYRLERNLHCVLGGQAEVQLRTAFAEAMQSLHMGHTPYGLLPQRACPHSSAVESAEPAPELSSEAAGEAAPNLKVAAAQADPETAVEVAVDELPQPSGEGTADCEGAQPDGAVSEGSTACDGGTPELRSPCGSFSEDEKSRGRSQSSDDEGARAPRCSGEGPEVPNDNCSMGATARVSPARWLEEQTLALEKGAAEGVDCHAAPGCSAAQEAQSQWPWWQHLKSVNVARAVRQTVPGQSEQIKLRRESCCLTVQELEDRMGERLVVPTVPDADGLLPSALAGRTCSARSTRAIAARVSKLCRKHMRYQ